MPGWLSLLSTRALDLGSGHDLVVPGMSPASGSMLTVQNLLGILSPSLSAFPPTPTRDCAHALFLFLSKINKHLKNFKSKSKLLLFGNKKKRFFRGIVLSQ